MPITHEFTEGVAVIRLRGRYGLAAWFQALDKALAPRGGVAPRAVIADLSESEAVRSRTADDLRKSMAYIAERAVSRGTRFAAVAPDDLAFGFMRMGQSLMEQHGVEIGVFRSEEEAWRWLDDVATDASGGGG